MKTFPTILVLLCLATLGRSQSVGLQTQEVDTTSKAAAKLVTCPNQSVVKATILTAQGPKNTYANYTLSSTAFDSAGINWTKVDAAKTFPQCITEADNKGAFMVFFTGGVCQLSLSESFVKGNSSAGASSTKTVYLPSKAPTGSCALPDGSHIASGTTKKISPKGCSTAKVTATCSSGTLTTNPSIDTTKEYFAVSGACAILMPSIGTCPGTCTVGHEICYPDSAANIVSFVNTVKGKIGTGKPAAVKLAYDSGSSKWKWNSNLEQPSTGSGWAASEPASNNAGFVYKDGLKSKVCNSNDFSVCCMIKN